MLQKINHGYGLRFIFVTPFLDEIDRVIKSTRDFVQPENYGNGKLENLHDLLLNGRNIATTHALFLNATEETMQLIYHGGYILILDEALQTLHEFNSVVPSNKSIKWGDIKWLRDEGYITADEKYNVHWQKRIEEDSEWHYSEVQRLALNGTLKWIDKNLFWEYPSEIFRCFKQIYVLTYLFSNSMMDSYLKMHNFHYDLLSVERQGSRYIIGDYTDSAELRREIGNLINIYDGNYNSIGNNPFAFSQSWIARLDEKQIKTIQKSMRNYKNHVGAKTEETMWTVIKTKNIDKKLASNKGFGYVHKLSAEEKALPEKELKKLRQFVPCNARATNDFRDRTTLIYLCNRYINPEYIKYYRAHGYELDEDQFALSEMVQWIWRSAIRDSKPINIFIPSRRMRNILLDWLGRNEEAS